MSSARGVVPPEPIAHADAGRAAPTVTTGSRGGSPG